MCSYLPENSMPCTREICILKVFLMLKLSLYFYNYIKVKFCQFGPAIPEF